MKLEFSREIFERY